MSKRTFHVTFEGILLIVATIACSLSSSAPSATELPNNNPTSNTPIQSTATESPTLPDTPAPQVGLKQEWTIKTGNLRFIGAASDGTMYGIGENLYAVISKDGVLLQTNEIDLSDCVRNSFSGGSGELSINNWFTTKSDGTILSTLNYSPCVIFSGNPPRIEKWEDSIHSPYGDTLIPHYVPAMPEGYRSLLEINSLRFPAVYWSDSRKGYGIFFVNFQERKMAFVDHNTELHYLDFPDDLTEKNFDTFFVIVTPWDDVYCTYTIYDELGNVIGEKKLRINDSGSESISEMPNKHFNSPIPTIYLPERKELYYIEQKFAYPKDLLVAYDLKFNRMKEYDLPANFPKIEENGSVSFFCGE